MGERGAHKHFLWTYGLDLFKSCCDQGVYFQPSQLFLSGVVPRIAASRPLETKHFSESLEATV